MGLTLSPAKRAVCARSLPWLATGLIATPTGSLLSRVINPLPVTAYSDTVLAFAYTAPTVAAAGCVWGWWRLRAPRGAVVSPPVEIVPDRRSADPFIERVRAVLAAADEALSISESGAVFQDGQCVSFEIKSSKPGSLTDKRLQNSLYERITKSIQGLDKTKGQWILTAKLSDDILVFTRKTGFPKIITPPIPARVARNGNDALDIYKTFHMLLGVDAGGEHLSFDPAKYPHFLTVGGTGSGKSVFNRALIELYRASGWMIFLGDGKTTDYTELVGTNNIVAVSQDEPSHIRIVRLVADELRARQRDAKNRKQQRQGDPFRRPPILLLLDEYATMKRNILSVYGKDQSFEADLKFIIRVGREFKVHLGIATQELYRDTVDGQILGNMKLIVSLGSPADKTISEAFPKSLQPDAQRIGGTISNEDRGRGMALITSDEGETVVEFQSFYGYSPAESKMPEDPAIAEQWSSFKEQVSDRIPKLYPRVWFEVDGSDFGDDSAHLYDLPAVLLDDATGAPAPEKFIYDPEHKEYLGNETGDGPQTPIPDLTELASGERFVAARRKQVDDSDDLDEQAPTTVRDLRPPPSTPSADEEELPFEPDEPAPPPAAGPPDMTKPPRRSRNTGSVPI